MNNDNLVKNKHYMESGIPKSMVPPGGYLMIRRHENPNCRPQKATSRIVWNVIEKIYSEIDNRKDIVEFPRPSCSLNYNNHRETNTNTSVLFKK